MFDYSDPSGSDHLSRFRALSEWRALVEGQYARAASEPDSAFTWIDALLSIDADKRAEATIAWKAFPILAPGTDDQIDTNRRLQEEYVEWAVFRDTGGAIDRIVFTTEFREYFGVLAGVSPTGIEEAIKDLHPGADPTTEEIYGIPDVTGRPMREREQRFLFNLANNPWNNGTKGIMGLVTPVNSIPALFGLAAFCGIDKPGLPSDQVCANVGGACVPGRQSDPQICANCQDLVRADRSFSLIDPIGIFLDRMSGIWEIDGTQVDINDPAHGRWTISRNGRRGTLQVAGAEQLTLDLRVFALVSSCGVVSDEDGCHRTATANTVTQL